MIDLTWNSRILLGLSQLNWADAELYLLHFIDTDRSKSSGSPQVRSPHGRSARQNVYAR